MHLKNIAALTILTMLWLISPGVQAAAPEKRMALVIGNAAYSSAPLANPVNDATDMAATLKDLGFEVILERDAGKRAMEEAVKAFYSKLQGNKGVGLFYYAGHGLQVRGQNYLVPVDAEIESEGDVDYRAVEAGWILRKMEDAGNPVNIVVLDACRNNPFTRGFRSAERGLAQMPSPTGSIIAYATAPGDVAADGKGRNGLYTRYLIRHLPTPGLSIQSVFTRVTADVYAESGNKQTPWTSSSLMGEFSLATATAPPPSVVSDVLQAEKDRLEREKSELETLKAQFEADRRRAEEEASLAGETSRKTETTYIQCLLPGQKKPVWHQKNTCLDLGGQVLVPGSPASWRSINGWMAIKAGSEQVFVKNDDDKQQTLAAIEKENQAESIDFSVDNSDEMQPLVIKAKGELIQLDGDWYAHFRHLSAKLDPGLRDSCSISYIKVGMFWHFKLKEPDKYGGDYMKEYINTGTLPVSLDMGADTDFINNNFWVKLSDKPYLHDPMMWAVSKLSYKKLKKPGLYVAFHITERNYVLATSKRPFSLF